MAFIRPLYTCGAFNRQEQRAVMYNTARGTCYTFEGVSALLVKEILAGKRECPIDTTHIAEVTGTTEEQVAAFFHESLMPVADAYRACSRPCVHRRRVAAVPQG